MAKYLGKRFLRSFITLFIILSIVFILVRQMPIEGYFPNIEKMSEEQIQNGLHQMGLYQPLLVQLFIVYNILLAGVSLPKFKVFGFIRFERFLPGVIALSLNSAAYLSEIIRSGIQSIDHGQTEAARSLGMTQVQNMRYIVLPQAIKNILPAIANEFVTIIKESSITYTIGVQDLMFAVDAIREAAELAREI